MELPPNCRCFYLVRHAESDRIGGACAMDPALTPRGEAQLAALVRHTAELAIDAIACSELSRARRTAEAIAAGHGVVPVIDAGWNELHTVGAWRDRSHREVEELLAARLFEPDEHHPRGESLRALHRRALAAWARLVALPARRVLVVSHNALLVRLVQALLGLGEDAARTSAISYPNAAISELWLLDRDYDPTLPGPITLAMRIADAHHLPRDLVTR
ncbi:MAG TPA: histidine phosphatase family protein [Kofleriaceae bacterium]|jgi:probable phosphoglycerate mutase|nr:histidine phosphatase family protein [Kofleriaceae bacterium]